VITRRRVYERAERSLEIRNADSIIERVSMLGRRMPARMPRKRRLFHISLFLDSAFEAETVTATVFHAIIPRVAFPDLEASNSEAASSATTARREFVREQRNAVYTALCELSLNDKPLNRVATRARERDRPHRKSKQRATRAHGSCSFHKRVPCGR